jgi:N-acetylmuramoyl-L-alanine amidase
MKERYQRGALLLLCAALAAGTGTALADAPAQSVQAAEQDNLSEELYYDSLELLAICVQAEAGNQSLLGRRLVVDVILNRVDDPDFPDTIEGVITQQNAFTSYWDGSMDRVVEPDELTFQAVQMELEQRSYPGLRYFRTSRYSSYGTPWRKVGAHYFSTK